MDEIFLRAMLEVLLGIIQMEILKLCQTSQREILKDCVSSGGGPSGTVSSSLPLSAGTDQYL
jgi:hypothetical protein